MQNINKIIIIIGIVKGNNIEAKLFILDISKN